MKAKITQLSASLGLVAMIFTSCADCVTCTNCDQYYSSYETEYCKSDYSSVLGPTYQTNQRDAAVRNAESYGCTCS